MPEPIAIVGMACLFPKAPDLASYWRNIVANRDCLSLIPEGHSWSPTDYYDADPKTPDKTWATKGGFLDPIPFDPLDHGVIPVALEAIDSDQLLALIVARECLKDAGIDPDTDERWDRDRTACVLGHTSTSELVVDLSARLHGPRWRKALARCGVDEQTAERVCDDIVRHFPAWQEQSFPGMLANVVAGRIANRLDLGGANATVDAACASSLAALELAVADLQAGRSDLALTGGSDTLNDIFMYMCFSKTPALSRNGESRPFDASSDGILIAEGIAIVALKRLADAERDGDRIYAVIHGIGASSDGRNKSIYAPNANGQTKAVRRAWKEAGFALNTVELIEAHGTGTKAGDLAEVQGLTAAFADDGRPPQHVGLGSVKSQIGHTKATAGAAGLVKTALALYHRVLPPTARVDTPNPKMAFPESPFHLIGEARPWVRAADHPRRAGVSAFGFGGSNYHVALEEYGSGDDVPALQPAEEALLLLGADRPADLVAKIDAIDLDAVSVHHAVRPALHAWAPAPWVLSLTAPSLQVLKDRLTTARELAAAGEVASRDGVHLGHGATGKLAVLFPGQGSQYPSMGRTLGLRHSRLRAALDRADEAFRAAGREPLSRKILPITAFDDATRAEQAAQLTRTEWAQPAIGAVSKGMAEVLASFGVAPDAVAGHSYGELVALHVAGVLDEDGLWTASRVRGEAMADKGMDRGTMAAVAGPVDQIEAVLAGLTDGVVLANRNHPKQGVISGSREGIAKAIEALADAGLAAKPLRVSAAFHSPLVADAAAPLSEALGELALSAPALPVYSNVTGAPYPAHADGVRDLLRRQITSPVDFVGIVRAMLDDGVRTFVECGPSGVLTGLVRHCAKGVDGVAIVPLDKERTKVDGDTQLKRALALLAARGVAIDVMPLLREPLPPEPRKAGSKATVWIGGANYKRPSTLDPPPPPPPRPRAVPSPSPEPARAAPAASARPALAPPRPTAPGPAPSAMGSVQVATSAARPLPPRPAPARPAPVRSNGTGHVTATRPGIPARAAQPRPAPSAPPAPTASAADPEDLAALLDATREALTAFQRSQAQTAEVHGAFLRCHATATERFSRMFASHARLVELATGAAPEPLEARAPTARPQATRAETRTPAPPRPAAPPTRTPAAPKVLRAPEAPPPSVDLRATLRATVADKTGYPLELVEPGMDLESDLGIDSIKRVEILAAVREALPHLPEVSDEDLGAARTLDALADLFDAGGPPRAASTPAVDVRATLLATVAEKTGYPLDLLEPGMDLESDLGIDSIKRVEILAAVQERLPGAPDVEDERLGSARTLAEVGDVLAALAAGPAPRSMPVLVPAIPDEVVPAGSNRKEVVLQRLSHGEPCTLEGPVAVTADPAGRAAALVATLVRRGVDAHLVDPDWTVAAAIAATLPASVRTVVHLAACGATGAELRARVRGGFLLARTTGPIAAFVTVSGLGGRFGLVEPAGDPEEGALSGLAKTLALEWPDTRCLALDLAADVSAERLADELGTDRATPEVGLHGDDVFTRVELDAALAPSGLEPAPVRPGDLVVVTGGARGVTARVLREVALRWQPTILCLGRSAVPADEPAWAAGVADDGLKAAAIAHLRATGAKPTPREVDASVSAVGGAREITLNLAAFRAHGSAASYASVDARDGASVAAAVARAVAAHGPVRGIVHGAGVIADKFVADKTDDQFDRVYDTKVAGLHALLGAVDPGALRVVAMFSSVAGRYGNPGQVDYAMGNEVLARAAARLRADGVPHVKVFAWGPWAGGMVSPALARQLEARGMPLIDLDDGARAFCDELESSSRTVEVVIGGPEHGGALLGEGRGRPVAAGTRPWVLEAERGFLNDHRIAGKPVLPFVMGLEAVLGAAGACFPELVPIAVRELAVLKGVVLESDRKQLTVSWQPSDPGPGAVATLEVRLLGDVGPLGLPVVHYRGLVDLGSARVVVPALDLDPAAIAAEPYPHSVAHAYTELLFHGPGYQGIRRIEGVSHRGIVAELSASTPSRLDVDGARWQADPVVLDSALQLVALWVRHTRDAGALPTFLGRYTAYGPFEGVVRAVIELDPTESARGTYTASFLDNEGRLLARIEDGQYAARKALDKAFHA